jgi:hypothetical protein
MIYLGMNEMNREKTGLVKEVLRKIEKLEIEEVILILLM